MIRKVFLFLVVISTSLHAVLGQRAELDREVRALFKDDKSGIWIRYYKGKVNDLDDVLLALGHDKNEFQGFYRYIKSGLTYYVKGNLSQPEFEWVESLNRKDQTGILEGTITGNSFIATRRNLDETFIQSFRLTRLKKINLGLVDCSDGLWLRTFKGKVLDDDAKIILQKENEGQLKGIIQFNNKISTYNLEGSCLDDSCNTAKLWLSNNIGKDLGAFNMQYLNEDIYEIVLHRSANNTSKYVIELDSEDDMHCATYRGKSIAYNYIFPVLEEDGFNDWIINHFKEWLKPLLKLKDNEMIEAVQNDQAMALAWVDIEYLGPRIVSGFISFYNPKDNISSRESFIFNFKKEENTDWKSLFKDIHSAESKINYFIQQEKEKMRFKESDLAYDWIQNDPFDDVCVRKDGLCFSTNFNGIYGERKIVVPYVHLKPYLKSKRFILKL